MTLSRERARGLAVVEAAGASKGARQSRWVALSYR